MAYSLPEDIKQRAIEKCRNYPYLCVQEPGTVFEWSGRVFVLVHDDEERPLWLEL